MLSLWGSRMRKERSVNKNHLLSYSSCHFCKYVFFVKLFEFVTFCFRHLGRNPFICDCNLAWLADYLEVNPIETSGAKCVRPKRMERKKLSGTKSTKFKCKGDFNSKHVRCRHKGNANDQRL